MTGLEIGVKEYSTGGWLVRSGIVEKHGKVWVAHSVTDVQAEKIARDAGTYGKGEKRRKRFAEERAVNLGRYIVETRMKFDKHGLWHESERLQKAAGAENIQIGASDDFRQYRTRKGYSAPDISHVTPVPSKHVNDENSANDPLIEVEITSKTQNATRGENSK